MSDRGAEKTCGAESRSNDDSDSYEDPCDGASVGDSHPGRDQAGEEEEELDSLGHSRDSPDFVDEAEHVGFLRSTAGNLPHILNRLSAHKKSLAAKNF